MASQRKMAQGIQHGGWVWGRPSTERAAFGSLCSARPAPLRPSTVPS